MMDSRPGDAFQPGDLLNNTYRIEAILGRGGTSDVYKARSEISGRLVALKVLKSEFSGNDDYLVLLTREEDIREIRHDAVVRYSENHRTQDGHVYLLMDYVEGPGLDKKLKQGPMSPEDLLVICRRVTEGLEAAHARNIVHRDRPGGRTRDEDLRSSNHLFAVEWGLDDNQRIDRGNTLDAD